MIFFVFSYQPYFFGDEASVIPNYIKGNWLDGFVYSSQYKARWISSVITTTLYRLFWTDRCIIMSFAIILQIIASMVFFSTIRLFGLSRTCAAMLTIATTITRFNFFAVYEVNLGMIEGSGWLFFIISMYFWVLYIQKRENFYCTLSLISLILAGLCHERYLPILAVPMIAPFLRRWLQKESIPLWHVILHCYLAVGVLTTLVIMSRSTIMLGTAAQPVSIFSQRTFEQFIDGILQIIGINVGPPYLVGRPYGISYLPDKCGVLGFFAVILHLVYSYISKKFFIEPIPASDANKKHEMLLLAIYPGYSLLLLLIAASISIRQELRWLHEPMILLISLLALFWGYQKRREIALNFLALCMLIATATLFHSQGEVYFVGAARDANAVGSLLRTGIIDLKSVQIAHPDNWIFQGDNFLSINFINNPRNASKCTQPIFSKVEIAVVQGRITEFEIKGSPVETAGKLDSTALPPSGANSAQLPSNIIFPGPSTQLIGLKEGWLPADDQPYRWVEKHSRTILARPKNSVLQITGYIPDKFPVKRLAILINGTTASVLQRPDPKAPWILEVKLSANSPDISEITLDFDSQYVPGKNEPDQRSMSALINQIGWTPIEK